MSAIPQSSLFIGIIPALIIFYFSLKKYEGLYKDKTLFITFVAGIIIGFISAYVNYIVDYYFLLIGLIIMLLIALFHQLFKTIILNIGRFQGKKETTLYGLSLGLGFGAAYTPFLIIFTASVGSEGVLVLGLVAIGSLGIILFHGATGALIGYSIYEGKLMKYLFGAIVLQTPLNYLVSLMLNAATYSNATQEVIYSILLVIYGFVLFWYISTKIMPQILTRKEKRKRSKS